MSAQAGNAATFEEIGSALGISRQTAFVIYRRAIRKLRKRYGGDVAGMLRWLDQERAIQHEGKNR